jgi:hypothetical protein
MTQERSPYDAVIADLEAKRDQMNTMIKNLKQMKGLATGVVVGSVSVVPVAGTTTTISHDAFFGLTLTEAARKYLSIVKKTVPHPQFCDALLDGGFKTSAANFREVVRSALSRNAEFVKIKGEWGLAGWYGKRGRRATRSESALDQPMNGTQNEEEEEENSEVKSAAQ